MMGAVALCCAENAAQMLSVQDFAENGCVGICWNCGKSPAGEVIGQEVKFCNLPYRASKTYRLA